MENEQLIKHIHDIVNKAVACQSYLRLLQKQDLQGKEKEYADKAYASIMETLESIKSLRSEV